MIASKLIDMVLAGEVDACSIDEDIRSDYGTDSLVRAIEDLYDRLKIIPMDEWGDTTMYIKKNNEELYKKADNILRELKGYFN